MSKILVIDDDDFIRDIISKTLRKSSFEVLEASNGNEALQYLKQGIIPDLVITDILMPDKEGLETISEIRTLNPDIAIIAMSGGGASKNMSFLEMAKVLGAAQTLQKPFKPTQLFDAINQALGKQGGS